MNSSDILFERRGAAGIVTLNRPKALNAVTHDMVRALARQLDAWAHDARGDARDRHGGGRAGVLGRRRHPRALRARAAPGGRTRRSTFWRDEYPLNTAIKRYPKPYVALIDGIVMGGGVRRLGARLASRRGRPLPVRDAGGRHRLLSRCRRHLVAAAHAGRARHLVRAHRRPAQDRRRGRGRHRDASCALGALRRPDRCAVRQCLGRCDARGLRRACGRGAGDGARAPRSTGCSPATAWRIFWRALDAETGADREWAAATAAAIRTKSPTSLKLALAQVRRGRDWSFEHCMQAEMRIVSRIVYGHDFYEGVRAVIVDKDNAPRWRPATLARGQRRRGRAAFRAARRQELRLP